MTDRRLKIVGIPYDLIVDIFNAFSGAQFIQLPVTEELPHGTRVVSVHNSYERRCFDAIVQHDTFDEVEEGVMIPRAGDRCLSYQVFMRRPMDVEYIAVGSQG